MANGSTGSSQLDKKPSTLHTKNFSLLWLHAMCGMQVCKKSFVQFHCDNQSVVAVIISRTSKKSQLIILLRELFLCAAPHNFKASAKHVAGKDIGIADALSRFTCRYSAS